MVEFFIEQGADANAKDKERGGAPASWAAYGGYAELSDYLGRIGKAQNEERYPRSKDRGSGPQESLLTHLTRTLYSVFNGDKNEDAFCCYANQGAVMGHR
jgi:hypothetical protein